MRYRLVGDGELKAGGRRYHEGDVFELAWHPDLAGLVKLGRLAPVKPEPEPKGEPKAAGRAKDPKGDIPPKA